MKVKRCKHSVEKKKLFYWNDDLFIIIRYVYIESYLQVMKQEHYKLSQEAHECANSIPNMNKMIDGVQSLGKIKSRCLQPCFTFTFLLSHCINLFSGTV